MSNKPPQDLRDGLEELLPVFPFGGDEYYPPIDEVMELFRSHMQAGFDEICTVIRDTKQGTSLETLEDNVKLRAAEWLLGSKEKR